MHTRNKSSLSRAGHITRFPLGSSQKRNSENSDGTLPARARTSAVDRSKSNHLQSKSVQRPEHKKNNPSSFHGRNSSRVSCSLCSAAQKDLQLKDKRIADLSTLLCEAKEVFSREKSIIDQININNADSIRSLQSLELETLPSRSSKILGKANS